MLFECVDGVVMLSRDFQTQPNNKKAIFMHISENLRVKLLFWSGAADKSSTHFWYVPFMLLCMTIGCTNFVSEKYMIAYLYFTALKRELSSKSIMDTN